jgi:hypothetical protein
LPRKGYGVAQLREVGCNPTVVALNPTDAVALDLSTTGADDAYTGASTNVTRLRQEANCLMHVRDPNAALVIS